MFLWKQQPQPEQQQQQKQNCDRVLKDAPKLLFLGVCVCLSVFHSTGVTGRYMAGSLSVVEPWLLDDFVWVSASRS